MKKNIREIYLVTVIRTEKGIATIFDGQNRYDVPATMLEDVVDLSDSSDEKEVHSVIDSWCLRALKLIETMRAN
jgi:hypothetical protein